MSLRLHMKAANHPQIKTPACQEREPTARQKLNDPEAIRILFFFPGRKKKKRENESR